MIHPLPWFERTFAFPYPVELLLNLLTRLRGTPARLEEAIRGISRERLVANPGNQWSALQHAGHLSDLEPLWLARLRDYAEGREHLTPADLTNGTTNQANHNARATESLVADFRRSRVALLGHIDGLDPSSFTRALAHPRLKTPMRLADHLFFVAEHDDHHLAQIHALAKPRE